jgi:hypothetical protein
MNALGRKMPTSLAVSVYAGFVLGTLVPLLETVRRWHQLTDLRYFINWFDDYLLAGLVLWAAWKTYRFPAGGQRFLAAAWGVATGVGFDSFFGQLQELHQPDPAPVAVEIVLLVKGILLTTASACMCLALRRPPKADPTEEPS